MRAIQRQGEIVSHYRLVEEVGRGAMGEVYRAEDLRLGRQVAIKFMVPELTRDEIARTRFVHEAQAASALDHPNVCTIYEIAESTDGNVFLVMAYYDGESLNQRIQQGAMEVDDAIDTAIQIAKGLAAAHVHGIVHRDIKPANVMLTRDGIVKIVDFGLAKLPDVTSLTQTGAVLGTVAYMSPEQARGEESDHRTDIWALGVIMYRMLTGHLPFHGESAAAVLYAILHNVPEPVHQICPTLSPDIGRLVVRALEKRPADRFQSAASLVEALEILKRKSDNGVQCVAAAAHVTSIAVLPFSDMSQLRDQGYFCEGIAEELINALSGMSGLRVASRTSAFQFQGRALDIGQIGNRLKVDAVLEGSVRRAGDHLRVTVQLVNVRDGYQLWSERYDRHIDDIFAVQEEIARAIVDKLRIKLLVAADAPLIRPHTQDLEAYGLYLQGRYYWSRRYAGFLPRALECFEHAVARDAAYAQAHTGVADAYTMLGMYGATLPRLAFTQAKEAAGRAFTLDQDLPEAHRAMAFVKWCLDWDWPAVHAHYRHALERIPHDGLTHGQFGIFLASQGRFPDAIAEVRRAITLDPVSPLVGFYAAATYHVAREWERALDECARSLELDPNFAFALWIQTLTLAQLARHDEAIESSRRTLSVSKNQSFFLTAVGVTHAFAGHRAEAQGVLDELAERSRHSYVLPLNFADIHAALGNTDEACTWMDRACQDRNGLATFIATHPLYDRVRSDPRFLALIARMGLFPPL